MFTSVPVVDGNVNTAYTYPAVAADLDGNALTFSVVTGPQGLTINPVSGLVTWSPAADELGTNNVMLAVTDGHGGTATQAYAVIVQQQVGNHAPVVISVPVTQYLLPVSGSSGSSYTYSVTAIDPDKDPLNYSLATGPAGMAIDPGRGQLSWSPAIADLGSHPVTVRVEDGRGGFDTQSYTLQVSQDQPGTLEGTVFNDNNANGVRDPIDPPLAPVVHLLTVPGTASPYLAGMPDGSMADAGDSAPAQSPLQVPGLSLVAGSSLMFTVPAGGVRGQPGFNLNGPDGDLYDSHHTGALNGLSDVTAPVNSLVGVFLGPDQPDSSAAPPALNFFFPTVPGGINYTTLSPQLKQVFFIGDGRTNTGQVQQVVVPSGATRFFLASMDSTSWNNNSGSFAVDVRAYDPSSAPAQVKLIPISTPFDQPTTVDFDEPLNELVLSVNYSSGAPRNFEAIQPDGTHIPFSDVSGFPDEVYFATARSGDLGGFKPGDLYSSNGQPGQIVRITDDGTSVINPWVTLPGETGALRGGLTFDQTGVFGGNLIVVTSAGNIWEVDVKGHATKLGGTGTFLEGVTTIPNDVVRYGPLAGKVLATDENSSQIFTIDPAGNVASFDIGIPDLEGPNVIAANENFFGVDFGNGQILGASSASFTSLVGDILLRQEASGLFRLFWDGKALQVQPLDLALGSASARQWEGANFTGTAGVNEVPPLILETGLPSWIVYLDQNHNGTRDSGEIFTTTDANGKYSFGNLTPGNYTVALEGRQGSQQASPSAVTYVVTLLAGYNVSGLDFGTTVVASGERGPKFTSTPPTQASAGQTLRYDATVSNPDGRPLTFDLPVAPAGMTVDAATGVLVWNPSIVQFGPQRALLRVRDDRGNVDIQNLTITVNLADNAPVITSTAPSSAVAGLPYSYQVDAQDADGDPLTYQLTTGPAGMVIDPTTALLSWRPTLAQLGGQIVTIAVSDGRGAQATQSFNLTVLATAGTQQPIITSSPRTSIGLGSTYLYQVEVADPNSDPLTFSLPTTPVDMTIDATGLIRWQPLASEFGLNEVSILVDDGRGGLATQDFSIDVTSQTSNQPPRIVSTPSLTARAGLLYQYDAHATDPDGDPVIWSLDTAPTGMSLDSRLGRLRWTATLNQLGRQLVILRATDAQGGVTRQAFTITVRSINTPPNILSSPPTQSAVGRLYSYAVQGVDPDGDQLTYSLVTAPLGMTIDPSMGLVLWTPATGQVGPQGVIVNVTDNRSGGVLQVYTVVVSSSGTNQPPVVTSIPVFVATVSQPYTYQATASDPEGDALQFSLIAAPVGMTIDATSGLLRWTPTTTQLGANSVLLAVTDMAGNVATQSFVIRALSTNHPPTITSTPGTTATAGAAYNYDVATVDPDGDPITFALSTAPAGMTIDSQGRITWSPQVGDTGSQPVLVTATDGRGGTASQSFAVIVTADTEAPQVSLFLSSNPVDLGTSVTVEVVATDNVAVTSLVLTENGVAVALDAAGSAVIPGNTAGIFKLLASASDAAGNVSTDSQSLVVLDPNVTGAPTVDLTTPIDNAMISAPTDIIGTVQDPNLVSYTLAVAPLGSDSFTAFFTGTTQVTNGVLGSFDPSRLQNDSYVLRLTATNTGGLSSSVETTINITQNLKLGNFTLSFTDLTVPVAGIPITVTRTYDTLTANESSDFGFGWRLEFRSVNLRTSVAPTGMEADGIYSPLQVSSHVYVTLPGGKRQGFTFQPTVAAGLRGDFLGIFEPKLIPDAGVMSSLTVSPADLRIDSDGSVFDFASGEAYNPASPDFGGSYLLTTTDGAAYDIDGQTGQLTSVSDANNNTLTFNDSGVTSSAGTNVTFERDAQGLITAVVDPLGNRIRYEYGANGDLVGVTDRTNNTTQFVYRSTPAHYLDQVIDPLGRTGVRTEYDAQGRLTKVIDAADNPVQLAYDPTHSLETITDQLGNTLIEEYDDHGNIVSSTDALGGVARRTYDANNNMLTQTDPLGRTTTWTYDDRGDALTQVDPLGLTTISTYTAFTFGTTALAASRGEAAAPFTRLTTSTDPLGNTLAYSTNFFGTYISARDPEGHTISVAPDEDGKPVSVTDADGNQTQFEYDSAGHIVQQIDALGQATAYTNDADGNQLTSSSTQTAADSTVRTLTTVSDYDAQGRLISFTDAEGGVTRTEYDAAGNKTAGIDPLGRRTEYAYDEPQQAHRDHFPRLDAGRPL